MNSIQRAFCDKGIFRGGLLFLKGPDALEMVRRCRELQMQVLGVDGFLLTDKTTQPLMEHSIDVSRGGRATVGGQQIVTPTDSWKLAEEFIRERLEMDLFFEVVCSEAKT